MENKIENPSAFPHQPWPDKQQGMRLKDYFAAKAMQGLISFYGMNTPDDKFEQSLETLAKRSYLVANAMLKERVK